MIQKNRIDQTVQDGEKNETLLIIYIKKYVRN